MNTPPKKYRAMLENTNDSTYKIELNFQALDVHGAYDFVRDFQNKNNGYFLSSMVGVYNQKA